MASRFLASRLRSHLSPTLRAASFHRRSPHLPSPPPAHLLPFPSPALLRLLSTAPRRATAARRPTVDIGARARQFQTRRLWTYALTFSCVAGFIVIVLANFQDQMVFYITPTDALQRFAANPSNSRFRLGGLVLEGSVVHPSPASPEIEFVITDLITDILVRYDGNLPDLFREGHSVVVEGFVRPFPSPSTGLAGTAVSEKAKSVDCYFQAVEVLAKHDEKYMPAEVAAALERNKKILEAETDKKRNEAEVDEKRVEAQA